MTLNIIEIEGKKGLYINFGISKNYEDSGSCSYSREYEILPYDSLYEDELVVNTRTLSTYKLTGTHNTIKIREDKIPYELYGRTEFEGVEKLYIRRKKIEKVQEPTK